MEFRVLQHDIHENAKTKGWWETPRSPLEVQMLIVSEIAEATEESRSGTPPVYQFQYVPQPDPVFNDPKKTMITPDDPAWSSTAKPEGEAIEYADAIIRILDYAEHKGWNMHELVELKHKYNTTRPHRHGGKLY